MHSLEPNSLFDSQNLAMALWVGLGVLSIVYLICSRTRWGAARPLSKCVILSVLAHSLLVGFAYVTQLFTLEAPKEQPPMIRVSIVETHDSHSDLPEQNQPASPKPWERLTPQEPPEPQPTDLERPAPPEQQNVERAAVDVPDTIDNALAEQPAPTAPTLPDAVPLTEDASPRAPQEARPAEELVQQEQPEPSPEQEPAPSIEALPRPEAENVAAETANAPPRLENVPPEAFELGGETPRLTDAAVTLPSAEAIAGPEDQFAPGGNEPGAPAWSHVNPAGPTPIHVPTASGPRESEAMRTATLPRRQGDGAPLPQIYSLRNAENREAIAERLGASRQSEAAVQAALAWLARNQAADGRWDASLHGAGTERRTLGQERERAGAGADTGMTALAVLAFLGNGHTHLAGDYRRNVQHGLEFLLRSQADDGNLAGEATLFARMYCHGMASLALSEAFAITGDERLLPYVQRAIGYTLAAQHGSTGGWRYQPADEGDLSQFGWQVMALKSAEQAGIEIPARNRALMLRFLQSVSSGKAGGLGSYRKGERPTRPMTAEGLICRYFLSGRPEDAVRNEAAEFILQEPPQAGTANLYYWYYATLALHQAQDDRWDAWNAALQRELLARQETVGENAGSWKPDDCLWGGYGGRVYSTSMAALCLEVYYRYLPLFVAERR